MIVGKNSSQFSASKNQQLSLKECGLKILIPAQIFTPVNASYEITATALWGGKFEFPENSKLVSGVYHISVSSLFQLNRPVTVQLEHCVNITDKKQAKYLSFVVAKSGPPFNFEYLAGGSFCPGSRYGTIHLKEFSYLAIVLCTVVGGGTLGLGRAGLVGAVSGTILGLGVFLGGAVGGGLGAVLGGVISGAIGYYVYSKYILISYTCME